MEWPGFVRLEQRLALVIAKTLMVGDIFIHEPNWTNMNFIFIQEIGIGVVLFCFCPQGNFNNPLFDQTIPVRLTICVNKLNCGPLLFLFYLVTHPLLVL